jgi:hypothetical protein
VSGLHIISGINCDWITPVKMTSEHDDSELASE